MAESFLLRSLRINDEDKFTWTAMGDLYLRWADEKQDELSEEDYVGAMQDAADCYDMVVMIDPQDNRVLRKIEDLRSAGFPPSEQGFDMGDPALDEIRNSVPADPKSFRFPKPSAGGATLDIA